jgi:hypothetical protein
MENPFKLVESANGTNVLQGRTATGLTVFESGQVETIVGVAEGAPDGSMGVAPVVKLSGTLWAPAEGTVVQLSEPTRNAAVASQFYQFQRGKLVSIVCIEDPAVG